MLAARRQRTAQQHRRVLPRGRIRRWDLLDQHLEMGQTTGEAFSEGRTGIGDQVVELLPAGAIPGQMRRDQVPAATTAPSIATARTLARARRPRAERLDIHAFTVAVCATSGPVRARRRGSDAPPE
ncbi:hypothetical protein GCM10009590_13810 [Brachybacterium alimentarium]